MSIFKLVNLLGVYQKRQGIKFDLLSCRTERNVHNRALFCGEFNCESHKIIWLITQFTQSTSRMWLHHNKIHELFPLVPFNWIKLHILLYKRLLHFSSVLSINLNLLQRDTFIVCSYSMSFSYGFRVSSGFRGRLEDSSWPLKRQALSIGIA